MLKRIEVVPPSGTEAFGVVVPDFVGVGLNGCKPVGVPGILLLLTGAGPNLRYPGAVVPRVFSPCGMREFNTGEIEDKSVGTVELDRVDV
jgi:hypothetical protein